jgi:hypothetical protein
VQLNNVRTIFVTQNKKSLTIENRLCRRWRGLVLLCLLLYQRVGRSCRVGRATGRDAVERRFFFLLLGSAVADGVGRHVR